MQIHRNKWEKKHKRPLVTIMVAYCCQAPTQIPSPFYTPSRQRWVMHWPKPCSKVALLTESLHASSVTGLPMTRWGQRLEKEDGGVCRSDAGHQSTCRRRPRRGVAPAGVARRAELHDKGDGGRLLHAPLSTNADGISVMFVRLSLAQRVKEKGTSLRSLLCLTP